MVLIDFESTQGLWALGMLCIRYLILEVHNQNSKVSRTLLKSCRSLFSLPIIGQYNLASVKTKVQDVDQTSLTFDGMFLRKCFTFSFEGSWIFWKPSVLEKTEGNKDFCFTAKLKVIPGKPSVLLYKKSKQKESRTEGNKGTPFLNS